MPAYFMLLSYSILQKTGDYFTITSKLSELHMVMDVGYIHTEKPVIAYLPKNPPTDNQLWRKENAGESTFYLVSKLDSSYKITIQVST